MKELTNQEIASVFGMYIGQRIKFTKPFDFPYHRSFGTIHSHTSSLPLYNEGEFMKLDTRILSELIGIETNEAKLILTSISKISDKHAIEVAKLLHNLIHPLTVLRNKERIVVVHKGEDETCGNRWVVICPDDIFCEVDEKIEKLNYEDAISIYQFLISKGYAVPLFFGVNHWANGKTAIELGIAIEPTEVTDKNKKG